MIWLVVMHREGSLQPTRYLHKDVTSESVSATELVPHLDEAFIWTSRRADAAEFTDPADPVALCLVLQDRLDKGSDEVAKLGYPGQRAMRCRPQADTDEWRLGLMRGVLRHE